MGASRRRSANRFAQARHHGARLRTEEVQCADEACQVGTRLLVHVHRIGRLIRHTFRRLPLSCRGSIVCLNFALSMFCFDNLCLMPQDDAESAIGGASGRRSDDGGRGTWTQTTRSARGQRPQSTGGRQRARLATDRHYPDGGGQPLGVDVGADQARRALPAPRVAFPAGGRTDEDEDLLVALHRVAPGLESDPATHEEVARCVSLCREGVALEGFLGGKSRSGPPNYQARLPRSSWEAVVHGEQTAVEERQRLGIGNAPIADVSELIASQGIWASAVGLPNEMSGVFLRHPSIGFAILVNSSHPRGRKRFSYAHEFAHALLDRDRNIAISSTGNSSEMVERRGKRVRGSVSHAEERRLRSVAKSRQGASKPPGTDHLRCRQRRPHRRGVSLARAFATDQLQGHRDARSPLRSELPSRPVPVEEPSPHFPCGVPGTPGTGRLRATAPAGAQHVWRHRRARSTRVSGP